MNRVGHAVIAREAGVVDVAEVQVGGLHARDVLIRTEFSGVSTGTDKWMMQGVFTWSDNAFPLVPGYQRSGVVEAVGPAVSDLVRGQRVVATESRDFVGAGSHWGAHASLAVTDRDEVYDAARIPGQRSSLFISGQVGYNAASRVIDVGDNRIIVYGDGIIGVSGALAARARGFEVALIGRHSERVSALDDFGIVTAISGSGSAALAADWRPTAVIDTVQNVAAFDEYVDLLPERTGQIVFSGHSPAGVTAWADMEHLQKRELTASFVSGWARDRIDATLQLMRDGRMPLERLAGEAASGDAAITDVMNAVVTGTLGPVAAILDWR